MARGRSTFAKETLRMLRTEDKVKEADNDCSEDSSQELNKFKQSHSIITKANAKLTIVKNS
jgi:hypothetical protein